MVDYNALLQNIDAVDLIEFARAVPNRDDFLLTQRILPERVINNVKYRTRNRSITIAAARYRSFNAPTPRLRSSARQSVTEGYLPPLGGLSSIEEFELILDEIARGTDDERLIEAVYDNVQNQVLGIRARAELTAGDLLADGIISLNENGQDLDADFGVPAENRPVAATLWSDTANSRMLDDELAWINGMTSRGNARPAEAITSTQVATLYARNQQYREVYWGGAVTGTSRPNLTPDQVNSVRGQYGLPPITTYDVEVPVANEVTGVISSVRVLPANRFIYVPAAPAQNLGESLYGLTAEGIVLRMGGNPGITGQNAPGIVSTAQQEDNPVAVTTKSTAVELPVLEYPGNLLIAQVLA